MNDDYKEAYLREKTLRKQAEQMLEDKSRELYDSFRKLQDTVSMTRQTAHGRRLGQYDGIPECRYR